MSFIPFDPISIRGYATDLLNSSIGSADYLKPLCQQSHYVTVREASHLSNPDSHLLSSHEIDDWASGVLEGELSTMLQNVLFSMKGNLSHSLICKKMRKLFDLIYSS
jgi:hypothetical protein